MNLKDEIKEVSDSQTESDRRESLRKSVAVARLSRVPQAPKQVRYSTANACNGKLFTFAEVDSNGIIIDPKFKVEK